MSEGHTERLEAALDGKYRVERELGEGGMATVYLADDLKHERKVALKVLKPELAAVVGAERFLAEIKTTANLQHPHILPLHDSGDASGFLYYVMPYVEGESLRERLEREKQLPVDEAVRIASDVAEALHAAHEQGVIHRDVKPANILLSKGRPLVADFGIALAVSAAGGGRLTETGLSMGTPYYMSPEQASADREPTPASDIYSLGCVLYEMLVGEPPYTGGSAQAVLAKILMESAPVPTRTRASIPAHVDSAIRKSLEKLPADRFTGAQAFASALADPGFRYREPAAAGAEPGVHKWNRLSVATSAIAAVFALVAGWALLRPGPPRPTFRLGLSLPGDVALASAPVPRVAVSPDGSTVVFIGTSVDGVTQLWQRPLGQVFAAPIPGTENARHPRFSPDGQSVVFRVPGEMRTVSLGGAPPQTVLAEGLGAPGHAWGADGMIYFMNEDRGISRVPVSGGRPEVITTLGDGESGHFDPEALPDGEAILYIVVGGTSGDRVAVAALESRETRVLFPGSMARFASSGHVVYTRLDGVLYAAPFDSDRLQVAGAETSMFAGVFAGGGPSDFAISESGHLVYVPGTAVGQDAHLVWVTRSGDITPVDPDWTFNPPSGNYAWSLSPEGTRVALTHEVGGNVDVYIKELPDGPFDRLTTDPGYEGFPIWSPDGSFVSYIKGEGGLAESYDAWRIRADGVGEPELLLDGADHGVYQPDWSPDGEWLVFRTPTFAVGLGARDVMGFRPGVDSVAILLVADAEFAEGGADMSPNGRWLAYSSDRTGREEVYVRSFPNVDSVRVSISNEGGRNPQWAHSGEELFFVDGQQRLVAARIEDTPALRVVGREVLFTLGAQLYVPVDLTDDFYEVAPDDQSFLMARPAVAVGENALEPIVVTNFFEELKRLAPN